MLSIALIKCLTNNKSYKRECRKIRNINNKFKDVLTKNMSSLNFNHWANIQFSKPRVRTGLDLIWWVEVKVRAGFKVLD